VFAPHFAPPGTLLTHLADPAAAHCAHVLAHPATTAARGCAAIAAALCTAGPRTAALVCARILPLLVKSISAASDEAAGEDVAAKVLGTLRVDLYDFVAGNFFVGFFLKKKKKKIDTAHQPTDHPTNRPTPRSADAASSAASGARLAAMDALAGIVAAASGSSWR
jgi:hypothetical protein